MADTFRALKWLNDNCRRYDFQIKAMSWPREYLRSAICDYEVSFEAAGRRHTGRGVDPVESLALIKALAECLERFTCHTNDFHSSGVAAHFNKEQAVKIPRMELLEHDLFFCHLLTSTSAAEIQPRSFDQSLLRSPERCDFQLQTFRLAGWTDFTTILAIACYREEVVAVGLGTHEIEDVAIQKARLEVLTNAVHFAESRERQENQVQTWLGAETSSRFTANSSVIPLQCSELPCEIEQPFHFMRVSSASLQPYLLKGWCLDDLNMERLLQFKGKPFSNSLVAGMRVL